MTLIQPTTDLPARSKRWRLYALFALLALGFLGYFLYPRNVARITTLDGKQSWPLADSPPRRQVIWQTAVPFSGPTLPDNKKTTIIQPTLDPTARVLYFAAYTPKNDIDIYKSHLLDGKWQAATPVDTLNSPADDLGAAVSSDGNTLYLYSNRDDGHGGFDIYQSARENDTWSEPVNLGKAVNTVADECEPALAPNGTSLYFTSNHSANMHQTPDASATKRSSQRWTATLRSAIGFNQFNIHRSRRPDTDSPWSEARPLTSLNRSDANDGAPCVDSTGSFLYFASDRPHRSGEPKNLDLYRCRIRETGHGEPENLGPGVNSRSHELEPSLSRHGFRLHFSRRSPDKGGPHLPRYDVYSSTAIEVEIQQRHDSQQLKTVAAFFRSIAWRSSNFIRGQGWWIGLALLAVGLVAGLTWYLRRVSLPRATVPVFFVWALAIHLMLGAGSFYIYFDSELLETVKKTFKSILVASKLPSDELHQSHKPGQEAYEKVADLKSMETVQTSDIARQIIESPNMAVATDSAIPSLPSRSQLAVQAIPRVTVDTIPNEPIEPVETVDRDSAIPKTVLEIAVEIQLPEPVADTQRELTRPRTETRLPRQLSIQPDLPAESVTPATPEALASATTPQPDLRDKPEPEPATSQPEPSPLDRQSPQPIDDTLATQVASIRLPPPPITVPQQQPVPTAAMNIDRADPVLILAPDPLPQTAQPTQAMVRLDASRRFERQFKEQVGPETVISQANYESSALLRKASPVASATSSQRSQAQLFANPPQNTPSPISAPLPSRKVVHPRRDDTTIPSPQPQIALAKVTLTASPQSLVNPKTDNPLTPTLPSQPLQSAMPRATTVPAESLMQAALSKVPVDETTLEPLSELTLPAPAAISTSRVETPLIEVPLNDSTDLGGPFRPSMTEVVIGSIGRQIVEAPITTSPHATALLRLPARAPDILYAEDNIGLQALLRLRNVDLEAKRELVKLFGGSEETLDTVNRGLVWIAKQQYDDGHWSLNKLRPVDGKPSTNPGSVNSDAAATAFALLPLLGNGNTHLQGTYKDHVKKGLDWLVKQQQGNGELSRPVPANSRMYSHGVATIALCEAYAMSGDTKLKEPAQRAVNFIVSAQHKTLGGWRYNPGDSPDTSVVGWQVMALKSAQMANLQVSPASLQGCRTWLEHVAGTGGNLGQFGYTNNTTVKPEMTAEALLCLQYLDMPRDDPHISAGSAYLAKTLPRKNTHSSYYWYYGTQVMYHLQGEPWKRWNDAIKPLLIATQEKTGHQAGTWPPGDNWERSGGRLLATSLRILMLEVYFRHLPLYKVAE
jgi:hypothetical protein